MFARLGAFVLAALCLAYGVAQTPWGRAELAEAVVSVVHDQLGLEARLREVRLELGAFPPAIHVVAEDIVLSHPTEGLLVSARSLDLRPRLAFLLFGRLNLGVIRLDRPSVRLAFRDGALVNGPTLPASSSSDTTIRLPLRRLVVNDARIEVVGLPVSGAIEGLDLDLAVSRGVRILGEVEARVGTIRHPHGEEALQLLSLHVRGDVNRRLEIARAIVRTGHLRVEVADARIPLPSGRGYFGRVELKANLGRLGELAGALGIPHLDGLVEATAELHDTPTGPAGRANASLTNVHIDEYGLGERVELRTELDPREVRILRGSVFHVVKGGGDVSVEGRIGLGGTYPISVRLGVDDLEFPKLMDQLGVTPNSIVEWTLRGGISLTGTLSPFEMNGPIEVDTRDFLITADAYHARPRRRIIGVPEGHIRGRVSLDVAALRFLDLDLVTARSHVMVDVLIYFIDLIQVRAHSDRFDVADVSPLTDFPLTGAGSMEVTVDGPYGDPEVRGHTNLRGFSFDGMMAGDVDSDFHLEEGGVAVRFPELRATKGDTRYRVEDLYIDFSEELEISGRIRFDTLTLDDLYQTFHLDQDGRFEAYQALGRGEAGLRYTYGFPDDGPTGTLRVDLDVALDRANLAGFAFTDGSLEAALRWYDFDRGIDGAELDIASFTLRKGEGSILASGTMAQNGVLELQVAADHLSVTDVEGLGDSFPELSGHVGILGEVRGTTSVPRADLDVSIASLAWLERPIGDGRAYVRLTDRDDPWVQEALAFDPAAPPASEPCAFARAGFAHGRWPDDPPVRTAEGYVPAHAKDQAFLLCGGSDDGSLLVDMALGFTSTSPHRGRIVFERFSLDPFLPPASEGSEAAHGELTGSVVLVDGDLETDNSSSGRVEITSLRLSQGALVLTNDGTVRLEIDRGRVQAAEAALVSEDTRLRATGGGSMQGLALSLEGRIGMGTLALLVPSLEDASGGIDVEIHARGSLDDPTISGALRLDQVTFVPEGVPVGIEGLSGTIGFSERRLVIDGLVGRMGGGELRIGGEAAIRDGALHSYAIDLAARDVSITPEDGLDVALGADVHIDWSEGRRLPVARGRISLDRVRYSRRVDLTPTIGELYRPARASIETYDPANDRLELDLEIVQRQPILVRNNLVELDIAIDNAQRPFRVVGTDQRPGVLGSLTIPRGILRFRSSIFDVRRGQIEFEDPRRIRPSFDLVAVTDVRRTFDPTMPSWRIQLRAYGTSEAFRLDATSTPALSQQDVVLLLMIGMTSAEAQRLQASDLSSTALEALSSLTGMDSRVRDALRVVDDVSLTTVYSPGTNRMEPYVTVGKRLSDRVRITAATGLTAEARAVRTTAEWRINDQTRFQASWDNQNRETASTFGNVGLDVRWHLEFE